MRGAFGVADRPGPVQEPAQVPRSEFAPPVADQESAPDAGRFLQDEDTIPGSVSIGRSAA
jgi:hypothetical protein